MSRLMSRRSVTDSSGVRPSGSPWTRNNLALLEATGARLLGPCNNQKRPILDQEVVLQHHYIMKRNFQ